MKEREQDPEYIILSPLIHPKQEQIWETSEGLTRKAWSHCLVDTSQSHRPGGLGKPQDYSQTPPPRSLL